MNDSPTSPDRAPQAVEEIKQAYARLGVCLVALLYMAFWAALANPIPRLAVILVSVYAVLSIAWIFAVRRWPGHLPARRIATIIGDLGINTFFMHLLQAKGAAFYPMYLWIIVGNGVRFGPRYLALAIAVGVGYFVPMLRWSPYWRDNLVAGVGLAAGLIILPLFYLSLIRRLHVVNARLGEELKRSNAAARAKSHFLATMSHELRTPMSGVLGVSDLLRQTKLDERQTKLLTLLHSSASSLLRILDDILDLSRLDAGMMPLTPTPVDLRQAFDSVLQLLLPIADGKNIDLRWDLQGLEGERMPIVLADAMRVRQILFNLVGNAVKFTDQGEVKVSTLWRRLDAQAVQLVVAVSDSGIGIGREAQAHIFEAFEQADDPNARRFGGTGLGLAISRQLARSIGGDITVSSELGVGTTFTVDLPFDLAEPEHGDDADVEIDVAIPSPVPSVWPISALVADDNEINRLVTSSFLQTMGASIAEVADGRAAVEIWQERTFDVIFMDVQMPLMDGLEATRRIRTLEAGTRHTPIVALTANASASDRQVCLHAGMDLHVQRPFSDAELRRTLAQLSESGLLPASRSSANT